MLIGWMKPLGGEAARNKRSAGWMGWQLYLALSSLAALSLTASYFCSLPPMNIPSTSFPGPRYTDPPSGFRPGFWLVPSPKAE